MSNTPHTLQEEFPGEGVQISALKAENPRFAKLLEDYDTVNDKVHCAQSRLDLITEEEEEQLRRERSQIKDEIARALRG